MKFMKLKGGGMKKTQTLCSDKKISLFAKILH